MTAHTLSIVLVTPALALALSTAASAQTGLIQGATVIAHTNGPVPDTTGAPIAGATFSGTPDFSCNPPITEAGSVLFRGTISGTPAGVEWAWFHGSSPSNLTMVMRSGAAVPGLPGLTVGDGTSNGLLQPNLVSPDGRLLMRALVSGPGVVATNDSACIGGYPGALTTLVREGDAAPGVAGASFGEVSTNPTYCGINRNGRMFFKNTLAGGVTTANDEAWFTGTPGSFELVVREGQTVAGRPVAILGTNVSQMNDSGQFLHQVTLAHSTGGFPGTDTDDAVTLLHTPGAGSAIAVREGSPAPGTAGGVLWGQTTFSPSSFTRTGKIAFGSAISGGDVVGTTNDTALFHGTPGNYTIAVRENSVAPGANGSVFSILNSNTLRLQDDGTFLFAAYLRGGDSVAGINDEAVYLWTPSALTMIARRGQLAPGANGSVFGPMQVGSYFRNQLGQIVISNTLAAGGSGLVGKSLWYFDDATHTPTPIWLPGETLNVGAGTETITDFLNLGAYNASNSASLPFNHAGELTGVLTFASGNYATVKVALPPGATGLPFCFGDGTGAACPCGNNGVAGNGCANSLNPGGANIVGTGSHSLTNDTLVLTGTGMPNSSALYFQGTSQLSGGNGAAFGDGKRCAAGNVIRLKTVMNTGGGSFYPQAGDPAVSVRGLVTVPGIRVYQIWYRNAAAYCTTSTFNLSNGFQVTWTH